VALPQSFGNNPESPENSLTIDIRNANWPKTPLVSLSK
jgi:hypothetical protein